MQRWGMGVLALCLAGSAMAGEPIEMRLAGDRGVRFLFPEPMQTLASQSDTPRATFTPALPLAGCHWANDTELSCQFVKPLPRATAFRATLPAGLRTVSGAPLPSGELRFETERPSVWIERRWNDGRLHFEVHAWLGITTAAIADVLRMTVDGKPVPVSLQEVVSPYGGPIYRLDAPAVTHESTLELRIVPGLVSTEGPLRGTQDQVRLRAIIGEPFQVRGAVCAGANAPIIASVRNGAVALDDCVPGEQVRVLFSRPLDSASVNAWHATWGERLHRKGDTFEPSYRTWREPDPPERSPAASISFTVDAIHAHQTLAIPALRANDGTTDTTPVTLTVGTTGPRPSFDAPFTRALLLPDGDPGLRSVNAPPVRVETDTIARTTTHASTTTTQSPEAGAPVAIREVRRALDESGYARIQSFGSEKRATSEGRMHASAPDFDVYARIGRRGVLVWANAWEGDAPISGANATLLALDDTDKEARVVASGTTNAQGVVRLALPAAYRMRTDKDGKPIRPDWFVRVERGRGHALQRAVLPIETTYWEADLGADPRTATWGVTDRPLYRAGDTVRWTVWTREDDGLHYTAPGKPQSLPLVLKSSESSNTLLSWSSDFDVHGRATGETIIPIHVPDGDYCIASDDDDAVCFHVGTFRTQDLWVRASSKQALVKPGDTFAFDIASGFYSGGSGAGLVVENVEAELAADSPAHAYPQWRDYIFARGKIDSESIDDIDALGGRTDAKGNATLKLPLGEDLRTVDIPFGTLSVSAEVHPADREGTSSNSVEVPYAAFARYVGLKVGMAYDSSGPVTLTGVVIDAAGREIGDQSIEVDVTFIASGGTKPSPVHACTIGSGVATECTFPRKRSGLYTIRARSADAAPAIVERYVYVSGTAQTDAKPARLQVTRLGEETVAGEPIRIEVTAPHVPARALVLISHGDEVIAHRVVTLASAVQLVELPTTADTPRRLKVSVLVRRTDAPPSKVALPAGFRRPIASETASVDLVVKQADTASPVSLAFERAQSAPAQTARLVLRNDSTQARAVTLAVTDDALRALGAQWLEAMDPVKSGFRERHGWFSGGGIEAGFEGWNALPLRWLLARSDDTTCLDMRLGECVITVVGNGAINPIDVTSVESTTILTAEQLSRIPVPRDTTSVALLAPGTVRKASGPELAAVEVAGATRGYAAPPAPPPADASEATPRSGAPRPERSPPADYGAALARIRTDFADTALWRTDIVLAPGESKTVEFVVPDNLTRWRAVAWSHDDADDFAMTDATLEVGLPVEARLQTPVRVYPGDTSRIALNARQIAEQDSKAEARITIVDGDASSDRTATLSLPANGQASFGTSIAPTQTGALRIVGATATPAGKDAVAATIDVASTAVLGTKTQAGWIGKAPMSLELPALPHGAHDAHVDVSVWRGASALVDGWTEDMRVYPHRCWEQILSRAVAAALAIERKDPSWPDADTVVREAIDNAGAFQLDDGSMVYFNTATQHQWDDGFARGTVPLTAYTLDAFALLRSLGHAPDPAIEARARGFLDASNRWGVDKPEAKNERAIAAAVVDLPAQRSTIAEEFDALALPARVAAARALARADAPESEGAFAKLLALAPQRGEARSLDRGTRYDRWMSSSLREQCELIRLLEDYPRFAPEGARRALIAGLSDLYAGGVARIDTQSAASCLRALRTEGTSGMASRIVVDATVGAQSDRIAVDAGQVRNAHTFAMPAGGAVTVAPVERPDSPVAFLARVEYQEDARQAQASAMGFSIARLYEVKRGAKWVPLNGGALREGDWVRITLTIDNADARYFVAVTDDLPGGLRPIDMDLSGVAGASRFSDGDGGSYFDERKLDPRKPKFYAQRLPAGHHAIRYYARVGNSGDYLAAPAVVELMYGESARARTAADRIRIADPK
ncbi:alpha-2-macroglobulin family protein [Noviluteimonas dokdonensis]|nr:alpha-2-macroglobulin family protein [Lysobacter dokdonensis]